LGLERNQKIGGFAMLILSGEEVQKALTMQDALNAVEKAYLELGSNKAVYRPRTDSWASMAGDVYYLLKSMDGIIPSLKVSAVRINSNLLAWKKYGDSIIKAGAGKKYVGLVVLFSLEDGLPLAIFPDEYVQAMRVGATTGLAIKYLAKKTVEKAAVFGCGRQGYAAIEAILCVKKPQMIIVYDPNEENKKALIERFASKGIKIVAAENASQAVEGADLLIMATSSISQVCKPEWVAPGRFISCVKFAEVGWEVCANSDYVVVNTHYGSPTNYSPGYEPFNAHDPLRELGAKHNISACNLDEPDWTNYPELASIVAGKISGPDDGQSVLWINNIGLGIQFAAVGAVIHSKAKELGLGCEISY
jgi:alanine dehydrogenase